MKKIISIMLTLVLLATFFASSLTVSADVGDHNYSETETNDTMSQAKVIPNDATVSGKLSVYDVDHFKFTLYSTSKIMLLVQSTNSHIIGGIKNSAGNYVTTLKSSYDNGYYYDNALTTLSPGTYYICLVSDSTIYTPSYLMYFEYTSTSTHTHSYSNDCDTTCNSCGNYRSVSHSYSNDCDTTCNVCGNTRSTSHEYSSNSDTTCNSCGATRTVLSITKQPANVSVGSGSTAKVTVTATGEGLQYKWYYKESWGSSFALTTKFTGNSYSVSMNDLRNGRQVYCVVTDKYGNSIKSNVATLKQVNAAKITKQPTSVTVENGKSFSVTVGATGSGLKYKWYYKDKGASKFSLTTSFTSNTYSSVMTDARDGRQVYCVVTDKYGNKVTTKTVTLSKKTPLTIKKWLSNASAENGKNVTVTVGAQGDGLKYQWYYKDKGAKTFTLTTSFTGPTYTVAMSDARNGRQLKCVVTDKYGKKATTNTVTISKRNVAKITVQPVSVKVQNGKTASVTLKATGDGLKYKWYYKESWGKTFSVTNSFTYNSYSVAMNANRNGRQLYCVVTDKYGNSVKSNVVTISMAQPVKIKYNPANASGYIGGKDAKFTVTATGDGLKYQWQVKTPTANWKNTTTAGCNTKTISVGVTAARNGYKYRCVITDKYGNKVTSGAATLYANKHTHSWTYKITKVATCGKAGVKTGSCYCGATNTTSIAATGAHSWKEATCSNPKTCIYCGKTSGSAIGHDFDSYDHKCDTCGIYDPEIQNFLNKYSLVLPTLPKEIKEYNYNDTVDTTVKVTDITYEFEYYKYDGGGVTLTAKFSGTKLYDDDGANYSDSCKIGWKLYDPTGAVFRTGTFYSPQVSVGESFRNQEDDLIYNFEATEAIPGTYRLEILNVS